MYLLKRHQFVAKHTKVKQLAASCNYELERISYLFQSTRYVRQGQTLKKSCLGNSFKGSGKWLACIWNPFPSRATSFHLNIAGQFHPNKCTPTSSSFDNLPSCLDSNNVILHFGRFSIDQKKIEMLCLLFSEHFHFTVQFKSSLSFLSLQQPFFVKELSFFERSLHPIPTPSSSIESQMKIFKNAC